MQSQVAALFANATRGSKGTRFALCVIKVGYVILPPELKVCFSSEMKGLLTYKDSTEDRAVVQREREMFKATIESDTPFRISFVCYPIIE